MKMNKGCKTLLGATASSTRRPAHARLRVYHRPGVALLTEVVPVDNVLFGSEMIGAVRGRDPSTGEFFDDPKAG